MSSVERDSLNLGSPYQLCRLSLCCNIATIGWTEHYDEIFTPGVRSPADSIYDVRIDVLDPQTSQGKAVICNASFLLSICRQVRANVCSG